MADVIEYKDLYANFDRMPGSEPTMRVGGTVVCPTTGWSAKLKPHQRNGSPPTSPLTLELDLVLEEPQAGNDLISSVEIEQYVIEKPAIDYYDVYIFGDGKHGAGPGQIVVTGTE